MKKDLKPWTSKKTDMKIAVGGDHAGFDYKQQIIKELTGAGYKPEDFGTHDADSSDYPDFAHPVAEAVIDSTPVGNSS